jgi:ribose transport system permease protein
MTRVAGVVAFLIGLYVALLLSHPNAAGKSNLFDIANRQGFYGVITIGVGLLIVTGGIDLSIGSVIGLGAVLFGVLMRDGVPPVAAIAITVAAGALIGLVHGLLVTQLKLQAFLVTLCGLFIYRGLARTLTDKSIGLGRIKELRPEFADTLDSLRFTLIGEDAVRGLVFPNQFLVMLVLAAVAALFLHRTVYGRYWYAIGFNEQAARYSGIDVNRHRIVMFVVCSSLAALGGVLWMLSYSDANPETAGQTYELYAITGAVLGGCSLRGGEGTAIGMVLGAMVLPVLERLLIFLRVSDALIPIVIGLTLLFGTLVDELFRRRSRLRR